MINDEEQIGRRLRSALHAESKRHPLPGGFEWTVAALLPDRAPKSQRLWPAATLASLSALGLAVAALVLLEVLPPSTASIVPTRPTAAVSGAPSTPVMITYDGGLFTVEYPSEWNVIAEGLTVRHYEWVPLVVGTGAWAIPCEATSPTLGEGSGLHCEPDDYDLTSGEIVVKFYTFQGPSPVVQSPPPNAVRLASGLLATAIDAPTTTTWQIYLPGWRGPLSVEAHFTGSNDALFRALVRQIADSVMPKQTSD